MTGLQEFYSDVFNEEWFGVVTGTSAAQQLPTGTARLAKFRADGANTGDIFIGNDGEVFYPLDAGEDTGWFAPIQSELNNYWYRAEADEVLYFWVQR